MDPCTCTCMNIQLSGVTHVSDPQWGFHSGQPTVVALLSVTKNWLSTFERGQELCAVFVDHRKAFDNIPHLPLLKKLCQYTTLGRRLSDQLLPDCCGQWQIFKPAPVISGVPQESVLGPLLFLIYTDELIRTDLSDSAKLTLYADDVLLLSHQLARGLCHTPGRGPTPHLTKLGVGPVKIFLH